MHVHNAMCMTLTIFRKSLSNNGLSIQQQKVTKVTIYPPWLSSLAQKDSDEQHSHIYSHNATTQEK